MAVDSSDSLEGRYRTGEVANASGYSVQQVRDLERLAVIPPAYRQSNAYRSFSEEHLLALRAYRSLATAVGPTTARATLRACRGLPPTDAVAVISSLHVGLTRERETVLAAQRALAAIQAEARGTTEVAADESMSITVLANALGVRPSTLRFWEASGLVTPERISSLSVRHYGPVAIREARVTAALRAAGHPIPAVRATLQQLRRLDGVDEPLATLQDRLAIIGSRTLALLEAGADLVRLLQFAWTADTRRL